MEWDGKVMKILRLSIFNIKKNKRDAFILIILIAISIMMMGIALNNLGKGDEIFDRVAEYTECHNGCIRFFSKDKFKLEYLEVIQTDDRIENLSINEMLVPASNASVSYLDENGEPINIYVSMMTEDNERKFEKYSPETSLSDAEIAAMEHPIWLPYYFKYKLGFEDGDEIVLVMGGKEFPFQIVGFYETCLYGGYTDGLKCVISDADYKNLTGVLSERILVSFDTKPGIVENYSDYLKFKSDFNERFEDITGKKCSSLYEMTHLERARDNDASMIKIIMITLLFISVIVSFSSVIMIRHKISNDIDRQMQSIGVLEALGYRSAEISRSYIYEYLILGLIGSVAGTVLLILFNPVMKHVLEGIVGHKNTTGIDMGSYIIPTVIILALIEIASLLRARSVKKYPPVVAFRKGIRTHNFRRNSFPIEKTGKNINFRLGLRDITGNARQNIGIFICIFMAVSAITFCVFIADVFRGEGRGFDSISGWEISDLYLLFEKMDDNLKNEIENMDEVRKAIIHTDMMVESDMSIQLFGYEDYSELENLYVQKGRFPEHDNEVLICNGIAEIKNLSIGDSMSIEGEGVTKDYIVVGITNGLNKNVAYATREGLRRIAPISGGGMIVVYLEEGTDVDEFRQKIISIYGNSVEDALSADTESGSYEDRIRTKAEEQMALMMEHYGADNVSYALKIGDKVIYGNTGKYSLNSITSYNELLSSQFAGMCRISSFFSKVFAAAVALIVSIILNFLIGTTIKNKREELGIKKSLGYTTKDLKMQMIWRIMPIAVPAIVLGSIVVIPLLKVFSTIAFGSQALEFRYLYVLPLVNVAMIIYIFISAYLSAGRVKNISVTELMTE